MKHAHACRADEKRRAGVVAECERALGLLARERAAAPQPGHGIRAERISARHAQQQRRCARAADAEELLRHGREPPAEDARQPELLPQLLRRAARYRGACAGLLVAVLAVLTSSLFIWRIDVTGNETLTTGQILRCLDECGVRPGTYWPALSNDLVRNDMILCLPELRWLTVNVHGSRAEVIVREKDPLPDITPDDTPVSIYASATGVILSMDVYAGEARVVPGAAVEPGDVLVSGAVTDLGGDVRPVCARADIRARTRQVLTGRIALTETEKQPAHGARTRWALRAGKKRINFYQNSGISDAECDKITYEYPFAIRGVFTLPFSLVRERVQPYRTADAPVSEDAARASLEQALLQQLRETIGADGAIISYETAAETTGNVLTVTLTAECEQEIGRAQATPDAEFLQLRPPAGEGTTADD